MTVKEQPFISKNNTKKVNDKREEMRIACHQPVQVWMSDNTSIIMTALNYSMKGIGISGSVYQVIPHVGEELRIHFKLETSGAREIDVNGIVKHIHLDGGEYYLGLAVSTQL